MNQPTQRRHSRVAVRAPPLPGSRLVAQACAAKNAQRHSADQLFPGQGSSRVGRSGFALAARYIQSDIIMLCGGRAFPVGQPDVFKPLASIGKGAEEIRVADDSGAYRVVYVARRAG